jgi:hypothetical protein
MPISDSASVRPKPGPPRFVAWFEPQHDVLPQVAEHFVSRMGKVSWMIATPEPACCGTARPCTTPARWCERRRPRRRRRSLWLTYYRSIFNPARLNADLMQQPHSLASLEKPAGRQNRAGHDQRGRNGRAQGRPDQAVGSARAPPSRSRPSDAQPERQQPSTLDECRRCELWQNATQAVAGEGPKKARIMLVGEQPGDQEDLAGQPFVGPAGKLLDKAMRGRPASTATDLPDQRRQAFQVGAARQAAPAQDAGAEAKSRPATTGSTRNWRRSSRRDRGAGRDGAEVGDAILCTSIASLCRASVCHRTRTIRCVSKIPPGRRRTRAELFRGRSRAGPARAESSAASSPAGTCS